MTYTQNKKDVSCHLALGAALMASALMPSTSHAALSWQVTDGVTLDWTNSLRYSAATRVNGRDSDLVQNPNLDDGNQNFSTGLISNRFELFSELDLVSASGVGARVSALGFYDTVYNRDNDNPGGTVNHRSRDYDEFTRKTREQHGRDGQAR